MPLEEGGHHADPETSSNNANANAASGSDEGDSDANELMDAWMQEQRARGNTRSWSKEGVHEAAGVEKTS